jgi:hypothetical protein
VSTLPILIQDSARILRAVRQEKERKKIQAGNEKVKLSLFADDKNPIHKGVLRVHHKILLDLINTFGKVEYKINIKNW